jgi:arylsulfatase A-like enzyme
MPDPQSAGRSAGRSALPSGRWTRFVLALVGLGLVGVVMASFFWKLEESVRPVDRVVLITIDTLRRDHLGTYGYKDEPTSPNIDAWAKDAIVFENTLTAAPWTIPALSALFTGRYPVEVGAYTNASGISPDFTTLPELFQEKGFITASFNSHALLVGDTSGFRRGFDEVGPHDFVPMLDGEHKMPFAKVEPFLMDWLEEHAHDRFFLWIHDMDPHFPPTEGNPYLDDDNWTPYNAEVRWTDEAVGRILRKLQALDIFDDSLIIFTADHGESFGKRGRPGHQDIMYDEVLTVPLILQHPALPEPRRIRAVVELLDLFPTIIELAGLRPQPVERGESLVPLLRRERDQRLKTLVFQSRYHFEDEHHELAVRDRRWKLLVRTPDLHRDQERDESRPPEWSLQSEETSTELYQTVLDPEEDQDVHEDYPQVVDRLRSALGDWESQLAPPPENMPPPLDEAGREALRALGYGDAEERRAPPATD